MNTYITSLIIGFFVASGLSLFLSGPTTVFWLLFLVATNAAVSQVTRFLYASGACLLETAESK